mmetsp:Transcript_32288/g.97293  ORF Transcript_32288/g.97293 Transcript_32288/m.97293 type:complete len:96 (+) Transcript_32288:1072-1359(+)
MTPMPPGQRAQRYRVPPFSAPASWPAGVARRVRLVGCHQSGCGSLPTTAIKEEQDESDQRRLYTSCDLCGGAAMPRRKSSIILNYPSPPQVFNNF